MAKSKAKKTEKKKKKNVAKKIFGLVVVVILVAAVLYVGATYYPVAVKDSELIDELEAYLETSIPSEADSNIDLPTTVEGYEKIVISWSSSDEETLTPLGSINHPSYSDGDKTVKLTATYKIEASDFLANIVYEVLKVNEKSTTFTIVIKALEATAKEKVNFVKAGLFVPATSTTDVGLLNSDKIFESVTISWVSSNTQVLTSEGKKVSEGSTVLTATLSCEDVLETINFPISIVNEIEIEALSIDFDNLKSGTYQTPWEALSWRFTNAILANDEDVEVDPDAISEVTYKVCRMRKEDSESSIETVGFISSPKTLSFSYEIYETDKRENYTKDTFINIYYMVTDEWVLLKKTDALNSEKCDFSIDVSHLENDVKFKIELVSDYASIRVDIDNVIITRGLVKEDVISWLNSNVLTSYSASTILPLTTSFGGVINWESDSPLLSKDGVVTRPVDTTKVNLTAVVTGFSEEITTTFVVTIPSKLQQTPLEIYFIDLGKYGLADCGESIYIKYEDIEILVDAGDEIGASNQAIKEVIDLYSNDKVIEYLFATHPDSDHIGGMKFIFETYDILNLIQFNGDHTTNLYQKYVTAYENEECSVCTALDSYNNVGSCTRTIEIAPEIKIEIINTQNYEGKETNTRSIVFILEAYGVRTLLTGDADNGSNKNLESDYMESVGNIDILKAVHHATKEGTTSEFLEAVNPEVVIITNGNYFGNKHGHPTPYAINRIYQYDSTIKIYAVVGGDSEECEVTSSGAYKCEVSDATVDRNGTIKITIDNNGYVITSEYYGENPLEISQTNYWATNPLKEASHTN